MSYPNWMFSLFAFVGVVVSIVPLKWTWNSWHGGLIMYMAWSAIGCLVKFIDSVVWNGNVINWAPVWCDISTRIQMGYAVAIPCCSLVINRRLNKIARLESVHKFKHDRIREFFFDIGITLGVPVFQMAIYTVVQGHRFNIFEDIGCMSAVYNTPVAMALVNAWPLAITSISLCYVANTLFHLYRRRAEMMKTLKTGGSMQQSQYLRLGALASMDILFTLPLAVTIIYLDTSAGLSPWISWENVHEGFSAVRQYPRVMWPLIEHGNEAVVVARELSRWAYVFCAFIFFAFFGFATEAMKTYRSAWHSVASFTGLLSGSKAKASFTASTTAASLGSFAKGGSGVRVKEEHFVKRDRADSDVDSLDLPPLAGDIEKGLHIVLPTPPARARLDTAIDMDGLSPSDAFSPTDTLAGSASGKSFSTASRPGSPDSASAPPPLPAPHAL